MKFKNLWRHYLLLLAMVSVTGCQHLTYKGEGTDIQGLMAWPFSPTSVRIHPFTMFDPIDNTNELSPLSLKVHIEFLDEMGDPVKGLGTVRIEVYELNLKRPNAVFDNKLGHWVLDLSEKELSQSYYDRITRTFVFPIDIEKRPAANSRLRLIVHFTDIYDHHMKSELILTSETAE